MDIQNAKQYLLDNSISFYDLDDAQIIKLVTRHKRKERKNLEKKNKEIVKKNKTKIVEQVVPEINIPVIIDDKSLLDQQVDKILDIIKENSIATMRSDIKESLNTFQNAMYTKGFKSAVQPVYGADSGMLIKHKNKKNQ
jgi:hypothetical protein